MKHTNKIIILITLLAFFSFTEKTEAQTPHGKHAKRHAARVHHRVHHRVVVRKAHVRYTHLPRWRASVTVVPAGAVVIKTKTNPYYFHHGVYYAARNKSYAVVRPVAGVRIRILPVGYRTVVVNSRNYYYYYGTFYTPVAHSDEYETVDAPEGALVDALPEGCDVKTIDGTEYYVLDDVYYAEVETYEVEDGIGYEVVKI